MLAFLAGTAPACSDTSDVKPPDSSEEESTASGDTETSETQESTEATDDSESSTSQASSGSWNEDETTTESTFTGDVDAIRQMCLDVCEHFQSCGAAQDDVDSCIQSCNKDFDEELEIESQACEDAWTAIFNCGKEVECSEIESEDICADEIAKMSDTSD